MASRSGRCGEFSPESKEFMKRNMLAEDPVDENDMVDMAAPCKRLQPRNMPNMASTEKSSTIAAKAFLSTPAKQCTAVAVDKSNAKSPTTIFGLPNVDMGCRVCQRDSDHANMLLCESCNDEYHTYCLNPPLESVPEDDFICGESSAWKLMR